MHPSLAVIQVLAGPPTGPVRAGLRRLPRWAHAVLLVGPEGYPARDDAMAALAADPPDWILTLEPDETFDAAPDALAAALARLDAPHATLPRLDFVEPHRVRLDGGWSPGRLTRRLQRWSAPPLSDTRDLPHLPIPILSYCHLHGGHASGPTVVTKRHPESDHATVLVTCPIRDAEEYLDVYLRGLHELDYPRERIGFYWLANGCSDRTVPILRAWADQHRHEYRSIAIEEAAAEAPARRTAFDSGDAHDWSEPAWRMMCRLRTQCLAQAGDHDFALFVDSDTVLLPPTLRHLVNLEGVDVVTEIHWTDWVEGAAPLPNVWSSGQYHFALGFLEALADTTVHPVGGMGGVVLIPRRVIQAGATYLPLPDLALHGEDRHFCARVARLGFRLHADTYYPAVHLYRRSLLEQYLRMRGESIR